MNTRQHQAEDYLRKPPISNDSRAKHLPIKEKRDEKDTEIIKLKSINMKLRKQLKELNSQLEDAIDKAKLVKKPVRVAKEIDHEEVAVKMAGK